MVVKKYTGVVYTVYAMKQIVMAHNTSRKHRSSGACSTRSTSEGSGSSFGGGGACRGVGRAGVLRILIFIGEDERSCSTSVSSCSGYRVARERVTLPPVDLRAVCMPRAMGSSHIGGNGRRLAIAAGWRVSHTVETGLLDAGVQQLLILLLGRVYVVNP